MSDHTATHARDSSRPPRPFRPLRIKWIFLCSVVFLVGYFSTQHRFQDPFLFERKFYAEVGLPCAPSTCDKRDVLTSLGHLSTQEIQCLISLPEPLDIINHTSFLVRQNAVHNPLLYPPD
jgi:hypothetical protein